MIDYNRIAEVYGTTPIVVEERLMPYCMGALGKSELEVLNLLRNPGQLQKLSPATYNIIEELIKK